MTVSIWQATGSEPIYEVDFLIIGAGLVGSAAAVFAAQAGQSVTLTEMRSLGMGASSRNAGFMITGLDHYYHHAIERYGHATARELWALSERTHAFWHHAADRAGVPRDRCGSLLLAESPAEARDLEAAARAMTADGIACDFLDYDPLGRGYHAAIRQPNDCAVQPFDLVKAVFADSGAALIDDNEVYGIAQESPDIVTVATRQHRFHARHVLICTNAYSAQIHPYFNGRVVPTRAQCLVTKPLAQPVIDTCGYSDYGYMYYRMTFDGRLLIGGGRKDYKALENNTTDDRTSAPVQALLERYLHARFPDAVAQIDGDPVDRRWAGIMGFSADGVPLVGTLPGMPRVGFAVGFTGHGLSFGAGAAERAVDHLLNGTHPGALWAGRLDAIAV